MMAYYSHTWMVLLALGTASAIVVRTPKTAQIFADYRATLPANVNVVEQGGWYALELEAVTAAGRTKLAGYKDYLPTDFDVDALVDVDGGGSKWTLLEQIAAAEPKDLLVQYMTSMTQSGQTATKNADLLDAITALLYAQNKGFDAELVDGDWLMVMQRQGDKSPSAQQLVGQTERAGKTDNVFDIESSSFFTAVRFWGDKCQVDSTVDYTPVQEGASKLKGDGQMVVPRRIMCDIVDAGVKLFALPRWRLKFLERKGGYLDFVYLDEDIRVTKGNRGGLFIHARPLFVDKMLVGDTL